MVKGFNWDCGISGLDAVLLYSMAAPGVKLRAFWMSGPGYLCRYEHEKDIEGFEIEHFQAVKFLEQLAINSQNTPSASKFDPKNDVEGFDWTSQYRLDEKKLAAKGKQSFYTIPTLLYDCR
jgi:hypothetical protein